MTTAEAAALVDKTPEIIDEVMRTHAEYARASQIFRGHLERLRAAIAELADSLSRDGMEAALRTVVAIQRGDADTAAAYAVATAQCARSVDQAQALLYGQPALLDAVDPQTGSTPA